MLPGTVHVDLTCGEFDLVEPPASALIKLERLQRRDDASLEDMVAAFYDTLKRTPAFVERFASAEAWADELHLKADLPALMRAFVGGDEEAPQEAETTEAATF